MEGAFRGRRSFDGATLTISNSYAPVHNHQYFSISAPCFFPFSAFYFLFLSFCFLLSPSNRRRSFGLVGMGFGAFPRDFKGYFLLGMLSDWYASYEAAYRVKLSSCHSNLIGLTRESLGDPPRKGVAGVRFPGAIPVRSAYALPQALVGLREWTEPDVIFERNILLGPNDNQALEPAENFRKQLVDTYKLLHPLMEVRERNGFEDKYFFAENDVALNWDRNEDVELDEDLE